jgi:dihydroorotase
MSKFLALGLPLEEVVASVTSRPAAAIGQSGSIGSLAPGVTGDAAVLDVEEGHFTFVDGAGHEVKAERRLRTRHVIRAGRRFAAELSDSDLVA